jgi:hypothetical protein
LNLREGDWDSRRSVLEPHEIDVSTYIRRLVSDTVENLRRDRTPLPKEPLDV